MKLNLQCGNLLRNGCLNINTFSLPIHENVTEDTLFAIGDYKNIQPVVKDQKFEEIIFNPPFNIIEPAAILDYLNYLKGFLTENGILKIFFIDIRRVARALQCDEISLKDAHVLIFGLNYEQINLMEANIMRSVAKDLDFVIENMSMKDFYSTFELKNVNNQM